MTQLRALVSGAAGALTVTLLNESVRRVYPHAPRMEVIGMRALAKSLRASGQEPPEGENLFRATLVGDILSNSLYYTLVGIGKGTNPWLRGAALGLAAGLGAAVLPEPLGLGRQPNEQYPITQALTVTWYLAGGLAAAATAQLLASQD